MSLKKRRGYQDAGLLYLGVKVAYLDEDAMTANRVGGPGIYEVGGVQEDRGFTDLNPEEGVYNEYEDQDQDHMVGEAFNTNEDYDAPASGGPDPGMLNLSREVIAETLSGGVKPSMAKSDQLVEPLEPLKVDPVKPGEQTTDRIRENAWDHLRDVTQRHVSKQGLPPLVSIGSG